MQMGECLTHSYKLQNAKLLKDTSVNTLEYSRFCLMQSFFAHRTVFTKEYDAEVERQSFR